MTNIPALIVRNQGRWQNAKLTRGPELTSVARRLVAMKARYQKVSEKTGVPWFVVAVIHERESSQNWNRSLAQGDRWDQVSTHVPAGRGPFASWEAAAIDALIVCHPYAAKWTDWTPGGTMTILEMYNGLAYAAAGQPSPYVWSGTDQYRIGKILVDHGPIEPVVDKQLGCAGLVMAMMLVDPSIRFLGQTPVPAPTPAPDVPKPVPVPLPAEPWWMQILKAILSLIARK